MSEEVEEKQKSGEEEKTSRYLTVLAKLKLARRSKIKKFVFVIFMLVAVTLAVFFTFQAFGFRFFGANRGAPDIQGNLAVVIIIFLVLYLIQSLTLNLIPGTTTFFITFLAIALFRDTIGMPLTFVISVGAVILSAIPLYFLGRYGGRNLLFWLFGREGVEKKLDWVARNGSKGLPWLMLIPFMTNDLLCVVCGASKMKFWHYVLIIIVFRPVEIAMLVFLYPVILSGFGGTQPLIMFLLINMLLVNFVLLIVYHRVLLNIFNKTFHVRKLKDLAAAQVAIMEAAEKETQAALAAAEAQEQEITKQLNLADEVRLLRQELDELKTRKKSKA